MPSVAAITVAASAIAAVIILIVVLPPQAAPRRRPVRRRDYQARHALAADPADAADPDGTAFIAALTAPLPAPLPEAGPDATRPIPHAVGTWGMTAEQLADTLAARYLAAPR